MFCGNERSQGRVQTFKTRTLHSYNILRFIFILNRHLDACACRLSLSLSLSLPLCLLNSERRLQVTCYFPTEREKGIPQSEPRARRWLWTNTVIVKYTHSSGSVSVPGLYGLYILYLSISLLLLIRLSRDQKLTNCRGSAGK